MPPTIRPSRARCGLGRQEAQRRPALEHRVGRRADAADLEEVVHDPDRVEADLVGGPGDPGEGRPDRRRPARPLERIDLEADLHAWLLLAGSERRWRPRARGRRRGPPNLAEEVPLGRDQRVPDRCLARGPGGRRARSRRPAGDLAQGQLGRAWRSRRPRPARSSSSSGRRRRRCPAGPRAAAARRRRSRRRRCPSATAARSCPR